MPASGTKFDAVVGTEVLHIERLPEVSFAGTVAALKALRSDHY